MKASTPDAAGPKSIIPSGLGAAALVFCAVFAAYLPSLSGDFIWNDSDYVTAPALRTVGGLVRIWGEVGATQQYYPLLHSAFWVQHRLWGDHPLGYHIVTLLLHAASAVLLALVLRRLLDGDGLPAVAAAAPARRAAHPLPGVEWLAALLFALHPVHVESVAWITEQKNTLSLAFYLAAALFYLDFDLSRRPGAYTAAFALFVCSLLCKTVTSTLPAAILVAFWWRRGRLDWRRDILPLVPWLVVGAAAGMFSSWVERTYGGAQGPDFDLPLVARPLVAGRAVWFYAGKLAWPSGLDFIYPRWTVDPSVWWQWLFPLGALAAAAALWALRGRTRAPLAAYLFFVGSLFPVLGFVNLYGARYSWVWDHWQYQADLGPLALAAAGILAVGRLLSARLRGLGPWLLGALFALLGALSWSHCGMFHDSRTLYTENLALNPGSWMAHNNLGCELDAEPGHLKEAIAEFEEALRLKPDFVEAQNSLGCDLEKVPGRLNEAIGHYEEALRVKPDFAEAHYNLGNALNSAGRTAEAVAQYEEALRLRPNHVLAHYNLGNALDAQGRTSEAIEQYKDAIRIEPGNVEARNNLGVELEKVPGGLNDAIEQYEEALRLEPGIVVTHTNLGKALTKVPGRLDDAAAQFTEALRLNPGYADAHFYLANVLVETGQIAGALQHYEEALRIQPGLAEASNNLGIILCRMGRVDEGLGRIEAAIRAQPEFARAHLARGTVLFKVGRREEAVAEFQKVLQLQPGDPSAQKMLELIRAQP